MKCDKIVKKLEDLSEPRYALDYDNVGLLVGRNNRDIKRILVTLDCDVSAVDYAISNNIDLIISHHPLIFGSIKAVNDSSILGKKIIELIENNINQYSMHTNFDTCVMGRLAGEYLGLTDMVPLDIIGNDENGEPYGIGVVGRYDEKLSSHAWCEKVKEVFGLPYVCFYGNEDEFIDKIAICPGSGKEFALQAKALGAKMLITGDVSHHPGIDAIENNMNICDATHFGIEYIFVDFISKYLVECFGEQVEVVCMPKHFPYKIY